MSLKANESKDPCGAHGEFKQEKIKKGDTAPFDGVIMSYDSISCVMFKLDTCIQGLGFLQSQLESQGSELSQSLSNRCNLLMARQTEEYESTLNRVRLERDYYKGVSSDLSVMSIFQNQWVAIATGALIGIGGTYAYYSLTP